MASESIQKTRFAGVETSGTQNASWNYSIDCFYFKDAIRDFLNFFSNDLNKSAWLMNDSIFPKKYFLQEMELFLMYLTLIFEDKHHKIGWPLSMKNRMETIRGKCIFCLLIPFLKFSKLGLLWPDKWWLRCVFLQLGRSVGRHSQ